MAQERKLAVSAINVRITDPAKREYDALFRSILRQRFPVKVYNNDYLILTAFGKFESKRMSWLGVVGRFTDIPDDADWLDTSTLKEADEDEGSLYDHHLPYIAPDVMSEFVGHHYLDLFGCVGFDQRV